MRRVLSAIAALALLALTVGSVVAVSEHCPDGGDKTEANGGTQDAINDTVLPAGTSFCVKAGPGNSGVLIADGETTLQGYAPDNKDVSYFVIYEVTPSESAAPSESVAPSESATPSESAAPSETPAPSIPTMTDAPTATPAPSATEKPEVPNTAINPEDMRDQPVNALTLVGLLFTVLAVGYALKRRGL